MLHSDMSSSFAVQGGQFCSPRVLLATSLPDLQNAMSRIHKLINKNKVTERCKQPLLICGERAKKPQIPEWLMPHYLSMWQIKTLK